jgi:DNA-binding PadR family transcriptional regulator
MRIKGRFQMSLEYAILGFLSNEELSGYDIKTRCVDEHVAHFWTADQAQIYRTLERLEKLRRVRSRSQRQKGKPDRKVFSITQLGREALDEWLATPHVIPPYRDPFLIQVYFGSGLPDGLLLGVLENARATRQARLEDLRARVARHSRSGQSASDRSAMLARLTLDAALAEERAAIDWLDDSIDTLATLADAEPQTRLFRSEGVNAT